MPSRTKEAPKSSAAPSPSSGRYEFRRTSKDRGDEAESGIIFECEDLRHGGEGQALYFSAFLGGASNEGVIQATITAANMPEPVIATMPVKFIESLGDIDTVATAMVKLFKLGWRMNRRRQD